MNPYNYVKEIEQLSGFTMDENYFNEIIRKCYNDNERWLLCHEESLEAILARHCVTFAALSGQMAHTQTDRWIKTYSSDDACGRLGHRNMHATVRNKCEWIFGRE